MARSDQGDLRPMPRRCFLASVGVAGAGLAAAARLPSLAVWADDLGRPARSTPTVRGAFLYPSTESLRQEGYYSWPGSGFDAEGHHQAYARGVGEIAQRLGMSITMNAEPLRDAAGVTRFINQIKAHPPDGLLLIPLKKSEWDPVVRIVRETAIPTVVFVTMGVLLNPNINELHREPGVYLICSLDDLAAVEYGMRMIKTKRWMRESRIVSLAGGATGTRTIEHLGTEIRALPRQRFREEYQRAKATPEVRALARAYTDGAQRVVEPSEADVIEAARAYVACKRILEAEDGDAITMDCLGGIRAGAFPPPCMAFMSLRDEGIAAGCQNELNPTLTMMLLQQLFDKPGFQQNASAQTEGNHYYGAHCTCASRLNGTGSRGEPYSLRSHAESGVGAVPQVTWRTGQEVTMAQYLGGTPPQMIVYSGQVVRCYDTPPAGGCRTNVELTINEVTDACDVKGMHQVIIYGNHARQLRAFCQLYGIGVVT